MFVLPDGYRPGESEQFTAGHALGSGAIAILASGDVRALNGVDNTLQAIDGITFRAGQ